MQYNIAAPVNEDEYEDGEEEDEDFGQGRKKADEGDEDPVERE